jgi:hypothetical protein
MIYLYYFFICGFPQMVEMSVLFAGAMPGNLVPGLSYPIIAAQKVPTESGMRLFVKVRATPQNIF